MYEGTKELIKNYEDSLVSIHDEIARLDTAKQEKEKVIEHLEKVLSDLKKLR